VFKNHLYIKINPIFDRFFQKITLFVLIFSLFAYTIQKEKEGQYTNTHLCVCSSNENRNIYLRLGANYE